MKQSDISEATDAQLLSRFEAGRDQCAFKEIVRRHGAMVLATAKRITLNREDAEDAFQATFFALAKGSGRIRCKDALVGWLHNTAQRCAKSIRRANARRQCKVNDATNSHSELATEVDDQAGKNTLDSVADDELATILDEELAKLPAQLKSVIILCELEGVSQRQAANQLGIASSTLRARLNKGRTLLKGALVRRGVTASLSGLTAYVLSSNTSSSLSASLIADTATKATLFAAGKPAAEIGVSEQVIHTASSLLSMARMVDLMKSTLLPIALLAVMGSLTLVAQMTTNKPISFYDDFDDGNYADGSPVRWTPNPMQTGGSLDASSGDFVFAFDDNTDRNVGVGAAVINVSYRDTSIRTQTRVMETGGSATIIARGQGPQSSEAYFAAVSHLPEFGGSVVMAGRANASDRVADNTYFTPSRGTDRLAQLSHDVRKVDTVLQLDIVGNNIKVWAWAATDSMPNEPQYSVIDDAYDDGFVAVVLHCAPEHTTPQKAVFRYVQVADTPLRR